jgi:hypothetical protein
MLHGSWETDSTLCLSQRPSVYRFNLAPEIRGCGKYVSAADRLAPSRQRERGAATSHRRSRRVPPPEQHAELRRLAAGAVRAGGRASRIVLSARRSPFPYHARRAAERPQPRQWRPCRGVDPAAFRPPERRAERPRPAGDAVRALGDYRYAGLFR